VERFENGDDGSGIADSGQAGEIIFAAAKNNFPKIFDWGRMGDNSRRRTHGWYKLFTARGNFYFDLEKLHKSRLKS
jgi:hypothetical protein